MPRFRRTWMFATLALVCAGCATRGNVEMLESELRRQEQIVADANRELTAAREELRVARTDADALRTRLAERHQVSMSTEQAEILYRAEAIRFNMLMTGGQERDGQTGDDGLAVLIQPVDVHGDMIKLAGAVELELFDLSRVAEDQRLGRWEFSAEDVREHWHRGFLSAGYLFQLDWQRVPTSSELTLHARLVAPDNRRFDATTQIKINPPGSAAPPVAQARQREPRPIAPPDEPPLLPPPDVSAPVERTAMPERARTANRVPSRRTSRTAQRPEIRPGPSSAPETPAVDTSDNWTEQTIPYLR